MVDMNKLAYIRGYLEGLEKLAIMLPYSVATPTKNWFSPVQIRALKGKYSPKALAAIYRRALQTKKAGQPVTEILQNAA